MFYLYSICILSVCHDKNLPQKEAEANKEGSGGERGRRGGGGMERH